MAGLSIPPESSSPKPLRRSLRRAAVLRVLLILSCLFAIVCCVNEPVISTSSAFAILVAFIGVVLGIYTFASDRKRSLISIFVIAFIATYCCHLALCESPLEQLAHTGAVLTFFGAGAIAMLTGLRILSVPKATALVVSTSIALFFTSIASTFRILENPEIEWSTPMAIPDAALEYVYLPNAYFKTYYPDDPRSYFDREQPSPAFDMRLWKRYTSAGLDVRTVLPRSASGSYQLHITSGQPSEPWDCNLSQAYPVFAGESYVLRFRARAESGEQIRVSCEFPQDATRDIGLRKDVTIGAEWSTHEIPFRIMETNESATIVFAVGSCRGWFELANVEIESPTERPLKANRQYSIGYATNAAGFRDRERSVDSRDGALRIACLGDSYTFGQGVRSEDTFCHRLEDALNEADEPWGQEYEVLNFGVCGYCTRQERICYELRASEYQPQVVLVTMVHNDTLSALEEQQNKELSTNAMDYSICVREILQLNELCQKNGARLGVVLFRHEKNSPQGIAMRDTIIEGLRDTQIPILDLGETFLKVTDVPLTVHRIDGHPNEIAHAIAARQLFRFLNENRLLLEEEEETTSAP